MSRRPPQVLLISPHDGVRDTLQWLLQTLGYTVSVACDGASGMEALLLADEPLVVVLELELPHLSGGELLRLIAASPPHRARHRFIVLADCASALTPEDAQAVRILQVPVFASPISIERFLEAVRASANDQRYLAGALDEPLL